MKPIRIKMENHEPTLSEQLAKIQSFGITALPVQKKARAKRVRWGEEETRDMLSLYEKFTLMNATDADVKSQADVCRSVEIEMKNKGHDKSWHQIKDRYTNLRVVYLKSQGMQRSACIGMNSASEFFDQISRIVELEGKLIRIRRTAEGMSKAEVVASPTKSFDDGVNNNSQLDNIDCQKSYIPVKLCKESTIAVPNPEIQSVLHAALMKRRKRGAAISEFCDLSVKDENEVLNECDNSDQVETVPMNWTLWENTDLPAPETVPKKRKKKVAIEHVTQPPASPGEFCQVVIESPVQSEDYKCLEQQGSFTNEYFISDEVTVSEVSAYPCGKQPNSRPKKNRAADLQQLLDFLREENLRLRSENQNLSEQYLSLASTIVTVSYLCTMQAIAFKCTANGAESFLDLD